MKKYPALVIITLALLGAGCTQNQKAAVTTESDVGSNQAVVPQVQPEHPPVQEPGGQNEIITNSQFGFQLTVPLLYKVTGSNVDTRLEELYGHPTFTLTANGLDRPGKPEVTLTVDPPEGEYVADALYDITIDANNRLRATNRRTIKSVPHDGFIARAYGKASNGHVYELVMRLSDDAFEPAFTEFVNGVEVLK